MTAKLATGVPEAGQIVYQLHTYILWSQYLMPGYDGVDISSLSILLLSSVHKAGMANILVIRQDLPDLFQTKPGLVHETLCLFEVAAVHGSDRR
jgi:hypothetical protein